MTIKNHILFWSCALILFLLSVWLLKSVLLPFVLGAAIAYLLEPIMEALHKKKLPRTMSALLILTIFFLTVTLVLALITPVAYRQAIQLFDTIPEYADKLWEMGAPYTGWLQSKIDNSDFSDLQALLQNNVDKAIKISNSLFGGLVSGGQALIATLSLLIITPLVAFFMMKEWLTMTRWLDQQIPRHSYEQIKELLKQIDTKISGFIRGQFMVALALGVIYATLLFLAGLDFGLLIGMTAGLLSIIPLIGSTVGLFVSVVIAWFQSGDISFVAIIAAIFMAGQFVEGNILTPRLLGKSVGLHPLWILFAIMAGGSLLGILGMFLAVPVTASIGVLIGFALEQYRNSPYYKKAAPTTTAGNKDDKSGKSGKHSKSKSTKQKKTKTTAKTAKA